MKTKIVILMLLLVAVGCGQKDAASPIDAAIASAAAAAPETARELTQYSAKQALARLQVELRKKSQVAISKLYSVKPLETAICRGRNDDLLSWVVGGWVFQFEDSTGTAFEAEVRCWGDVRLTHKPLGLGQSYLAPIAPNDLVVDNRDANQIILEKGGVTVSEHCGGSLSALAIEDRGIRPVWAGDSWIVPNVSTGREMWLGVDAQTGEIYRFYKSGDGSPVFSVKAPIQEWDGGFDKKKGDTLTAHSTDSHWWPYSYRDLTTGRLVYNRQLLRQKLKQEEAKTDRKDDSWTASGVIKASLGNYGDAITDLSRALEYNLANESARKCRGFIYLMIRDLDAAAKDLQDKQTGHESAMNTSGIFQLLRGDPGVGRFLDSVRTFQIKEGTIPLELNISDELFQSREEDR